MRSKIGTQSRLAAHIVALFLLILMLVYITPPAAEIVAAAPVVEPAAEPVAPAAEPVVEPVVETVVEEPATAPLTEPVVEPAAPVVPEPVVAEAEPVAEPAPAVAPEPIVEPEPIIEPAPVVEEPVAQPDESGALVVAPVDAGASEVVAAPLKNANLEVLGDGFYWLSPKHDLEKELAAIPEIATLIVLAPLPGHVVAGFEHVKTEVIPADPADLTRDAADQFVHLATKKPGSVVAAALPGARGAAFFKAAYLLRERAMSESEAIEAIAPELEEAGSSRGEVLHRTLRLAGAVEGSAADAAAASEKAPEETHDSGGN